MQPPPAQFEAIPVQFDPTPAEAPVLGRALTCCYDEAIAQALGFEVGTVRTHLRRLLDNPARIAGWKMPRWSPGSPRR